MMEEFTTYVNGLKVGIVKPHFLQALWYYNQLSKTQATVLRTRLLESERLLAEEKVAQTAQLETYLLFTF